MPVDRRDPVAVGRDDHRSRLEGRAVPAPEDLCRLRLDLLLFPFDVRDDVVHEIPGGHAGIAGSREGLQRGDDHPLDAELSLQGRESESEPDRRAVGVGDDAAGPASPLFLYRQGVQMPVVHLRDQQGDVGGEAVVAAIAQDGVTGLRECSLDLPGYGGVERREDDVAGEVGLAGAEVHFSRPFRHIRRDLPANQLAVVPSSRPLGCGQRGQLEPRMRGEHRHEPLPHRSRRTEHTGSDLPLRLQSRTSGRNRSHRSAPRF